MPSSSIPPVEDVDRRSTASLSASVGPVTVGFAVFGGAADLSVFVDGELIDPADWTLTSDSGLNVTTDVLPANDGRVTFDNPQTGDVEIIGEINPKRISQFTSGVGIPAESFNLLFSTIAATLRELYSWGKAALKLAPGERAARLPAAADRAGKVLSFSDPGGDPETIITAGDISSAGASAAAAAASASAAQTSENNIIALLNAADFTFYVSGIPSDAFGSDGDVYVNTAHVRWSVYGPKTAGAWGSIVGYMFGQDGAGNVNASSNFGTDNRLLRSDGTGTNVQSSGISVNDSDVISGGSFANTALKVRDGDGSNSLAIVPGSNLSADRTLTIATGDADRTLTLNASVTLEGNPIEQGKHLIGCWCAADVILPTTSPADALAQAETTTNKVNYDYVNFPDGSTKYVGFNFRAPESLNEGAFDVEIEWTEAASATAHVCRWQAEAQAQGDGDTIDSAWGTAVAADDTGSAGTHRKIALPSITPAGSWAAGDTIHFRIARLGGHANDTLDVGARLLRVSVFGTINAKNDA